MNLVSLNQLPLFTDDFFFHYFDDLKCKDAIVVFNPSDCIIMSPVFLRSRKTLMEHVEYIQKNNLKKAIVVAEDIQFLRQCPSLECLRVYPAISANVFDYSPLYELPNLKQLQCETLYGMKGEKVASIDYSCLKGIKKLLINGGQGHNNVQSAKDVVALSFDFGFPNTKTLSGSFSGASLKEFSISQSPIRSLDGIEAAVNLCKLELSYNRRLTDISALSFLKKSLTFLEIDTCGKIQDYSVLSELYNLEFLSLKGSNGIPNLSFLQNMPRLKSLQITMNVENGDLHLCERVPYVKIKNRRHYSHKDADLPKDYTEPQGWYTHNIL